MSQPFEFKSRLKSFTYAINGIIFMMRTQHNAWVHLAVTILVCAMGLFYRLNFAEWRWIMVSIIMVWIAETTNTAFEHLCDLVSPEFHPSVQKAKDIAAGAVLISAIGAVLIGLSIFAPHMLQGR